MIERRWLILAAVSLMFFFITAGTFASLGVVLVSMITDLHWTQTQAGGSFSVLGVTCCLSSLAPMALVNRIGARWTLLLGGLTMACGYVVAFAAHDLWTFLLATGLMGVGFSLSANIPGVFLLAQWFPQRSGRVIGAYLMSGAFGGVAGPPLAQAFVAAQGWRALWLLLAVLAAGMGLLCLLSIRDTSSMTKVGEDDAADPSKTREWRYWDAILTPQFVILALGMVVTEGCVTIVNSAGVLHFSKLGLPVVFGALMLSLQALMATAGKGLSGVVGDWIDPRLLLVAGLAVEGAGVLILGSASSHLAAYLFAVTFGIGWGTAYLAITVMLIDYFGPRTGSSALSLVWLLTTFAALGPAIAGAVADRFGSYAPVFYVCGALLIPIALAALVMRRPSSTSRVDADLIQPTVALVANRPL